jgi:hypothetical protein
MLTACAWRGQRAFASEATAVGPVETIDRSLSGDDALADLH